MLKTHSLKNTYVPTNFFNNSMAWKNCGGGEGQENSKMIRDLGNVSTKHSVGPLPGSFFEPRRVKPCLAWLGEHETDMGIRWRWEIIYGVGGDDGTVVLFFKRSFAVRDTLWNIYGEIRVKWGICCKSLPQSKPAGGEGTGPEVGWQVCGDSLCNCLLLNVPGISYIKTKIFF